MGLHIGEGLETTVTGMQLGLAPAWVLGSAGATRTFPVLDGIEALRIFTEAGDASANVRAVRECASRCPRPAMNSTMH